MRRSLASAVLAMACVAVAPAVLAAPAGKPAVQSPKSAAELRALELLAVINKGERKALDDYLAQTFTAAYVERYGAATIDSFGRQHLRDGRLEFESFTRSNPTTAVLRYRSALTGDYGALEVVVEPGAAARIADVTPLEAAAPAGTAAPIPVTEAGRMQALDAYAARLAAADAFSGVVLVARDGEVLLHRAYGEAERSFHAANRPDTKFNVGSMDKMFTAVAVARLVEQGKLSYDDPLSKFLPDFPDPESARKIRIKHLLSHTSGLGSYFNPTFAATPPGRFRDQAAYMAIAGQPGLKFEPGAGWSYSNTGMLVLGQVISQVTGRDYYDYMRETLFHPLGMTDTEWFETDSATPNMAQAYETRLGDHGPIARNAALTLPARGSSAGGGYSTAPDLLRFSDAFLKDQVVSADTRALLTSAKPELGSKAYGFGFDLGRFTEGRDVVGHGGDAPGTCAVFGLVRDAGAPYTVIILANSSAGSCHPLARKAYQLIPAAKAAS